jgi:phenylalanyl-tRNA synthetase beta chain
MKVSVNWIKEYLDFELPPIDELVTKIGAQLGAVEEVINIGAKYKGVVVAKIVSCEKHPNADKLNVCVIDDGGITPDVNRNENGYVQVVCGAPNVREELLVAWIPPKAIVPSTYDTSDPFTLEARELRGVVSNGMLASGKELAINEDHDGILEIDQEAQLGQAFAEIYDLNDYIIDIENKMFTHRPDCFGQLGVAREIAGILGHKFTSPDWYLQPLKDVAERSSETLPLEVRNEIPELTPRFMAVAMSGIDINPSPIWLQSYLSRIGIRPINNVVDVTNYIMVLTAQPLHAYDYDKVKAIDGGDTATLVVRKPRQGEKLTLLGGKEIEPRKEAILIASTTKPIGLGGVMGGTDTEVDQNTKNIILECANFDMYSIRRTSMAHGLFTEAVTRFNKGQSPLQNDRITVKAMQLFGELAEAKQASEILDDKNVNLKVYSRYNNFKNPTGEVSDIFKWGHTVGPIEFDDSFVNKRLGTGLKPEEIAQLLRNVEISAWQDNHEDQSEIEVIPPFWRTDIQIEEDIVEEVGRLYGFDKLPLELPKRTITPTQRNSLLETKAKIRDTLRKAGANEVLTYSFVHGDLIEKMGQNKDLAFQLSNALSPELQYYRINVLPSLLDKIHQNIKAGYDEFALFEMGKNHALLHADDGEDGLPREFDTLAFVYTANDKLQKTGAAYYEARNFLQYTLQAFGIEPVFEGVTDMPDIPIVKPYEIARSAYVKDGKSGEFLGIIGEFRSSVKKSLKLPQYTAGFEVDVSVITKLARAGHAYNALPKFPKVMQDITLRVPATLPHATLHGFVKDYLEKHKEDRTKLTVIDKDIYQRQDDKDYKQVTFSISIASYEKTMRDEEVNKLLDNLVLATKAQIDAERV